jgi:hypothetical protein
MLDPFPSHFLTLFVDPRMNRHKTILEHFYNNDFL